MSRDPVRPTPLNPTDTMPDPTTPDPEFLAQLERATHFELRRAARPTRAVPFGGAVRAAALTLLAFGAGAGVVIAAERVADTRRAAHELARNEVERALAERRAAHLQTLAERARVEYHAGRASQAPLDRAEARAAEAKSALAHLQLEREALQRGGPPLRRAAESRSALDLDLTAPLVGPRDFVSEHLRVELAAREDAAARAARERELVEVMARNGMRPGSDVRAAETSAAALTTEVAALRARLALRAAFLQGERSAEEVAQSDRRTQAEAREQTLTARIKLLAEEVERAEQLSRVGVVSSAELANRALDLAEAEGELALVRLELELDSEPR